MLRKINFTQIYQLNMKEQLFNETPKSRNIGACRRR